MKRMNLVLAMVAALIGTALAGTALAQDEGNAFQTTENPSVLNAQQYGRGGDSGQNHDNGWGNDNRQGWAIPAGAAITDGATTTVRAGAIGAGSKASRSTAAG